MFSFYATFDVDSLCSYIPPGVSILLPASSWARKGLKPPTIPSQVKEAAADSGGYVASRMWGEYRYTLDQYVTWLLSWKLHPPTWAACMDYCCEPDLCQVTRERQQKTTANAREAWQRYRDVPFVWVPTVQGLEPDDYRQHAAELAPLISEMQAEYGRRGQNEIFRAGIGTLCRRADSMTIRAIVMAVREVLPRVNLHLWGIKLASIRALDLAALGVMSTDSATWSARLFNADVLREEAKAASLSAREYSVKRKLPEYIAKVEAAAHAGHLAGAERQAAIDQVRATIAPLGWTLRIRTRRAREYIYAVKRRGTKLEERYLGILDAAPTALKMLQLLVPSL